VKATQVGVVLDCIELIVRRYLPRCWGGWLQSVGCVQLYAVAHQGGWWVQLELFNSHTFWTRRWAPPEIGLCGGSSWCEALPWAPGDRVYSIDVFVASQVGSTPAVNLYKKMVCLLREGGGG
jgi:hypothetical protein